MVMKISKYKHDLDYSYTLGATLTYELLKTNPNILLKVYIRLKTNVEGSIKEILSLSKDNNIEVEENEKVFNILSPKDNCYVIGMFKKEENELKEGNHIVLVNPSNAGNLGTILRTCTGFGIGDVAIIKPSVDYYDPKTVRASMGAIFHLNIKYYDNIDEYINEFKNNKLYSFMLQSSTKINKIKKEEPYSLIFGNEATGLPDSFLDISTSVIIPHSNNIDSLNLPIALSIGLYEFTKDKWQK